MIQLSYFFSLVLLFSLSFFSCNDKEQENTSSISNIGNLKTDTVKSSDEFPIIDTVSLKYFWNEFKENLVKDQRKKVIEVLDFPVYATHIVLFNFSHNCDTALYVKKEEDLKDLVIDEDNIEQNYDFIFSETLKEMIHQTSVQDLLLKGRKHKNSHGLSYGLFPKEYEIEINCSSDHLLIFHITFKNEEWKIKISGL